MERTLAMIKPDGVCRGLIGEIIKRIESEHLNIVKMKMMQMTGDTAQKFYSVHMDKPFFGPLIRFTCSGPVVVMVLEGLDAVRRWRNLMGATNSSEAAKGTIRGDFGDHEIIRHNVVHGSDSIQSALSEINILFKELTDV
jgi:nucleoside-diphosphate kinase